MSFVSLNTALSGIRAGRAGMDTASHNVANANTDGFTRQRVELSTGFPYLGPHGPMGTGVTVEGINRVRDGFLDARLRGDMGRSGQLDVRADLLGRAELVLGEPETGLTGELTELWAAFEDLALSPEDRASRRQVLSALESLAARVRSVAGGFETLQRDTTTTLTVAVDEVNDLIDQVADLNGRILESTTGSGVPNDLLDRRDVVVDDLARKVGAGVTVEDNGTVRVSVAGLAVVSGTRAQHLGVDPDTLEITHPVGMPVRPGGEIAGLQGFLTDDLPGLRAELDGFVADLVDALNTQHAQGYTADGTTLGGDLLAVGSTSLSLSVVVTDPDDLAAAAEPDGPHDGRNATALADLRTASGLDGALRTLVTDQAATVAGAERVARGQQQLTAAATAAREGMHGVSIDEEMVQMLSHQRALEASSRMMTAVDEALDILINRTGLVGR